MFLIGFRFAYVVAGAIVLERNRSMMIYSDCYDSPDIASFSAITVRIWLFRNSETLDVIFTVNLAEKVRKWK